MICLQSQKFIASYSIDWSLFNFSKWVFEIVYKRFIFKWNRTETDSIHCKQSNDFSDFQWHFLRILNLWIVFWSSYMRQSCLSNTWSDRWYWSQKMFFKTARLLTLLLLSCGIDSREQWMIFCDGKISIWGMQEQFRPASENTDWMTLAVK